MSDHISKNSQVKAGRADTIGIKLKPVTDTTKLILDGAKAVVGNTGGNGKVLDNDREMDLTFYDANGNIETADPDGDTSMEDDASSSINEHDSVDTSITTVSDGAIEFNRDDMMQSVKQNSDVFISAEDLFSSDDDDMPNTSGGLDGNGNPDEDGSKIAFNGMNQRCDDKARDVDSEMP